MPLQISSGTLWGHRARRGLVRDDHRRAKCAIYFMPGGRLELPRPCGQRILSRIDSGTGAASVSLHLVLPPRVRPQPSLRHAADQRQPEAEALLATPEPGDAAEWRAGIVVIEA